MSEQLEMPGMPRRLFSATPSKLATYADCPRRYRFAYLTGPRRRRVRGGRTTPSALRCTRRCGRGGSCRGRARGRPAAARQLLYGVWSRTGFRDDEQAERWRARAAGWLTDYVGELDPADEPVGTERTVGATTERLALSGRIDRIDQRGDELVVVDYKTGRVPSTEDEARGSPALAVYVLGVRRTLRRPCCRVELHHLPCGTVAVVRAHREVAGQPRAPGRGHRRRHRAATEALAAGADADEAFPPVPGRQCGWCDFRPSCPAGQAAVPARETWSFLAEEDARRLSAAAGVAAGQPPVSTAHGEGHRQGRHDDGDQRVQHPPGGRPGEDRPQQPGAEAQRGEPEHAAQRRAGGEPPAVARRRCRRATRAGPRCPGTRAGSARSAPGRSVR